MWTAASIALLLRARSQAELRRKEWEEWAVERHGSLQAAYSNPRVKVPKVEELLVEEWGEGGLDTLVSEFHAGRYQYGLVGVKITNRGTRVRVGS